ncbi:MAG: protoporphyrinogen oxidase HemJ [Alphaproteobacteria bacterium]
MSEFLIASYPWIKSLHLIFIIAWMAALLYLPRLFVYHTKAEPGSELSETLKVMEGNLLKIIMTPAMIASWVFGIALIFPIGALSEGWFHAKLLLVIVLSGLHGYLAACRKAFAEDRNRRSERFFRILNEGPTVIMIAVVVLVVVKPF